MKRATEEELKEILGQAHERLSKAAGGCGAFARAWSHDRTGGIYLVSDVTLRETDLCPMVTYYQHGEPQIRWSRELVDFVNRFKCYIEKKKERPFRNDLPPYEALRKCIAQLAFPGGDADHEHDSDTLGELGALLESFDIKPEEACD